MGCCGGAEEEKRERGRGEGGGGGDGCRGGEEHVETEGGDAKLEVHRSHSMDSETDFCCHVKC